MRVSPYFFAGGFALLSGCQMLNDQAVNPVVAPPATQPVVVSLVETPAAEEQITDLWERIRQDMTLAVPDKKLVNHYRDWYIAHPQHLAIVSERAAPFLYLIVEELEKRRLPIELALLPIVESSFDPFAYSHGAASGLWQFTSPMASHFGLKMNWWYDGRRDVPAATTAALDMLEYLYNKTGQNWLYAIAAYNTGEGRVLNAIKHNESKGLKTDFWSLRLPKETKRYVPQLLALADVIKHADDYGITLAAIDNAPQIAVVDADSQIDLALAARLAKMSTEELQRLNPGFNRWATAPEGPHTLVLPIDKSEEFKQALADTDSAARINWLRYQIKSGDSIGVIAKRHNTTIAAIRSSNGLTSNTIVAGKYLLIPVSAQNPELYTLSMNQRLNHKPSGKGNKLDYKVKAGDSLWTIARAHKVKIDQLSRWNHLNSKNPLQLGQKLVIWTQGNGSSSDANAVIRTVNYQVKSGDSLARIASRFKVRVSDLIEWNDLGSARYIQPGQMLKLLVNVTKGNV
ncbi:LysM peptidoglycan-binding domain-containing protein [Shewanella sp. AS16]|uniref:lytic transglycosylase n=1 Tax=Shewanella sp. AS16 TaxID=2907625 RepID=UPI001F44CE04|nr:LysM peptidoglycan-binding domain-containing protein [Shewanella sp. AS16]MCE9684667.1 LysM peptidoglycan-binding domain-containing protein [Shewanella sp. AS16]